MSQSRIGVLDQPQPKAAWQVPESFWFHLCFILEKTSWKWLFTWDIHRGIYMPKTQGHTNVATCCCLEDWCLPYLKHFKQNQRAARKLKWRRTTTEGWDPHQRPQGVCMNSKLERPTASVELGSDLASRRRLTSTRSPQIIERSSSNLVNWLCL